MKVLIELIVSFASTVGFGLVTNVPRRSLFPAGITGSLAWVAYYLVLQVDNGLILPNFTAAIVIGILGNISAVMFRVPVNIIYVPSLVSLVPGGILYLGMRSFTLGNEIRTGQYMFNALTIAIALAVGFVVAEVIFYRIKPILLRTLEKQKEN
ncbi:threonine/serine exporter family protein [Lentilactobacillus otakiensis]|uniref:threonine/serine exporter family protein n=1 Tax=Lentilactobacillus otakiensis TaxID=481720 RepID=UPI003D174F13